MGTVEWEQKKLYLRGYFIEQLIRIEALVSTLLADYFFIDDKTKAAIFKSKFLDAEFFNFGRKITILLKILNHSSVAPHEKKKLKSLLSDCEEFRNKLAHIPIDTSSETKIVIKVRTAEQSSVVESSSEVHHSDDYILLYEHNGKRKIEVLNKERFDYWNNKFLETMKLLENLR